MFPDTSVGVLIFLCDPKLASDETVLSSSLPSVPMWSPHSTGSVHCVFSLCLSAVGYLGLQMESVGGICLCPGSRSQITTLKFLIDYKYLAIACLLLTASYNLN